MSYYGLSNPDGRNDVIIVAALGIFSTATTILRFLSRRIMQSLYMVDDYLAVGATLLMIVNLCLHVTMVVDGGVGNHVDQVDTTSVQYALKALIPSQCLYAITLAMAKTSLLSLYMRIFGFQRWVRIHIWLLVAIIWVWAVSTILEAFLICRPFAYNWNTSIPGGVCGNRNAAFVSAGAVSMITDIMVLVVPLPNIWNLMMPLAKKIALLLIFCLGMFVSAISIIRMISLRDINFKDITYSLVKPLLWSIVETQLAIVVVNLPLLRPMMVRILPFIRMETSKNTVGSGTGHALTTIARSKRFTQLGDDQVEDGYILRKTEITVFRRQEPLSQSQTSLCAVEEA